MQCPTFRIRQRSSSVSRRAVTKQRGFTLLEVVLVVSLLLVLTAVALPGLAGWQARLPLDQAVATIQQACLEARVAAIQTGTTRVVKLSVEHPELRLGLKKGVGSREEYSLFELGQDIASIEFLDLEGSNVSRLLFYPDGTSSAAQITVTDDHQRQVLLRLDRLTGIVRLEEPSTNTTGNEL